MRLIQLDRSVSLDYIARFTGFGFFADHIVANQSLLDKGRFFTFLPDQDIPVERINQLDLAGIFVTYDEHSTTGVVQSFNYPEDTVLKYSGSIICTGGGTLVVDDYIRRPYDQFVIEKKLPYYLAEDKMFFMTNICDASVIEKTFISPPVRYGYFALLTKGNYTGKIKLHTNISEDVAQEMIDNTQAFFIPVYDDEGYLVWVREEDCSAFIECSEKNMNA